MGYLSVQAHKPWYNYYITPKTTKVKIVELANSVDSDEAAHYRGLYCLLSSLMSDNDFISNFADLNL